MGRGKPRHTCCFYRKRSRIKKSRGKPVSAPPPFVVAIHHELIGSLELHSLAEGATVRETSSVFVIMFGFQLLLLSVLMVSNNNNNNK